MNVLFVCNQGRHRSRTAAELFRGRYATRYAGLYNDRPVTERELAWADLVVVMEEFQRTELSERFPKAYLKKRIISLGIPDIYSYNQPELVEVLKRRMGELAEPFLELEPGASL
jgi:predicted protein tyrosine phosphatase